MRFSLLASRFRFFFGCLVAGLLALGLVPRVQAQAVPASEGQVADTTELRVLRQFYHATAGTQWTDDSNWLTGTSLAEAAGWYGVTVQSGDVVALSLVNNHLQGPLPAAVGQLVALTALDLRANLLQDSLPPALGQLTELRVLNLAGNQFTGRLPAGLGQLSHLQSIELNHNQFAGPFPASTGNWHELQWFSATDNRFSGQLPAAWGQLAALRYLQLDHNHLAGPLPAALGNASHLLSLRLGGNLITGPLPARWGRLQELYELYLAGNLLSGVLPDSLNELHALRSLGLDGNQLEGPLPTHLEGLVSLSSLGLSGNRFTGPLPASLGQLPNLQYAVLSGNRFTGPLPAPTGAGWRHLWYLDANSNQLSGSLPDSLGRCRELAQLLLNGNGFTGPLPAAWGQLAALQQLQLIGSHLSGTLPASVLRLPQLQLLRLENNDLADVADLGPSTALPGTALLGGNFLDFTALERLYQGGAAVPRLAGVDPRGQRPPARLDTVRYRAGQALLLGGSLRRAPHGYRYQWQRRVAGLWADMPGDTLPTKTWNPATAAEQGAYRRAEHDRWFTDANLAPTVLYSSMLYADLLPYPPLARNLPVDARRGAVDLAPVRLLAEDTARTGDVNFVRSWAPRVAVTDSTRVPRAPVDSVASSTTYLDGLGRPVQTVQHRASPQGRDLVQPQAYDALGREPRQFLPFPADPLAARYGYHPGAVAAQDTFYRRLGPVGGGAGPLSATDPILGVARTGAAFAETLFEASPLNRVVAQGAAGEEWQLTAGHVVERAERPNTAADSVLRFAPGYDAADRDPHYQGFYAPGELWGTDVSDAHGPTELGSRGYRTVEWTDKEGHVVLRQVEAARGRYYEPDHALNRPDPNQQWRSRWARTAYAYDDFGRLRYVIQPEGTKQLLPLAAGTALPAPAAPFVFHYRFDGRGRQIAKQVPGTDGETVVVFDQLDRPVLSQDAAQRGRREWAWTKYDALGRVVLSGLVIRADTAGQVTLQTLADADTATAHQYEQRAADGVSAPAPYGFTTTRAFPRLGQGSFGPGLVLSVTHYDDYNFDNDAAGTADAVYDTSTDSQFPAGTAPVADASRVTGLVTRSRTRVLAGADDPKQAAWLTTTTFYDERARPVQVQATNARKDATGQQGTDLVTTQLNFAGQPVQSVAVHTGPNHAPVTVAEFFAYDHTGRLLTTRQQLPGEARAARLDSVAYNELGQVAQKTMGTGRLAQQTEYAYNIRGWLTSLNNPYAPVPADLFNLSLHYERGFTAGYEQYNGNLTGQTWRGRDGIQRAYGYAYDPLNRLLQGDFVARAGGAGNTAGAWAAEADNYRLSFASYDDNGNIKTLRRRGLLAGAGHGAPKQYGPVDHLTYAYQGNRLQAVEDEVSTNQLPRPAGYEGAPTSLAGDFQESNTHLAQEYLYDANGNTTQDRNKGLSAIAYNHLNLPRLVHFGMGADSLVFRYTASGQKVAKLVYQAGKPVQRTDYLGPYQYEGDSLRFFPHAEGRVLRAVSYDDANQATVRYAREFTFKDQLGNLRLAYRAGQHLVYTAHLDLAHANQHRREAQQFDSLSVSAPIAQAVGPTFARSDTYVARLHAGGPTPHPLGPLKQLAVQKGDTVSVTAFGYYPQAVPQSNFLFSLASFVASLWQPQQGGPPLPDGRRSSLPLLNIGISAGLPALTQAGPGVPKGYVRLLVFDADSNLVSTQTQQLSPAAHNNYEPLTVQVIVPGDGYATAYVGNESNADVYFDAITVEHGQGLQVQETQYDPTGLELAGVSRDTPGLKPLNQYKFNGKEFQTDLGLNWNHQDWRFIDFARGPVWHGVDPLSDEGQENWSPYAYNFGNAVRFSDPDGRCPCEGDVPSAASILYNTVVGIGVSAVNTVLAAGDYASPGGIANVISGQSVRASMGSNGEVSFGARPVVTSNQQLAGYVASDALDAVQTGLVVATSGAAGAASRGLPMGAGMLLEQAGGKVATNAVVQEGKVLARTKGAFTEPKLPNKTVAKGEGIEIVHYTKSGDHGPPHLHVKGGGAETRIGQAGKPLANNPALTAKQQGVVSENKAAIRKAVGQIGRYVKFENR